MPKQLNIDLAVRADTSQAKKNLEELHKSLNKISSMKFSDNNMNNSLNKAAESAKILEQHLSAAFSSKTGNLDLSKLDASLKSSNQSLTKLSADLLKAGLNGEQAFVQVQKAIGNANLQLSQAHGLLNNFLVTLKNTAKWQISSSVLHGFMGTLSSAFGYAERLNASLNDIRIVTGQSAEQMAKFAKQANLSAQALSTTTTKYTEAALIFYQQGLNDRDVKERTDATVKMANVTKDSVDKVSSYMTAIWNNFDNGSQSIEHYADVITALGASTASSSAEIAAGLEKFAAIADVTGLSYEYATSALATLVSNTRQSADVVGTSLKTIFSRLEGVSLGETLEDGVDLNKYSNALAKVGVQILDMDGEMKNLDVILDDLAAKWDTLTNAQKMALAQTVAGVRQYNNLISLMDNWGDMQDNLITAQSSAGALSEQADIYAESWDAARQRVKASLEGIYDSIINDEFFIKLNNGFADILSFVEQLIDGMGGVKTILLAISTILLNQLQPSIAGAINIGVEKLQQFGTTLKGTFSNFSLGDTVKNAQKLGSIFVKSENTYTNIVDLTKKARDNIESGISPSQKLSNEMSNIAKQQTIVSDAFKIQQRGIAEINKLTNILQQNSKILTADQQAKVAFQIEELSLLNDKRARISENQEKLQQELETIKEIQTVNDMYSSKNFKMEKKDRDKGKGHPTISLGKIYSDVEGGQDILQGLIENTASDLKLSGTKITGSSTTGFESLVINAVDNFHNMTLEGEKLNKQLDIFTSNTNETGDNVAKIKEELQKSVEANNDLSEGQKKVLKETIKNASGFKGIKAAIKGSVRNAMNLAQSLGVSKDTLLSTSKNAQAQAKAMLEASEAATLYQNKLEKVTSTLANGLKNILSLGGSLSTIFSTVTSIGMAFNSISSAINTLGDESADLGQKLTSVGMAVTMSFSTISSTIGNLNKFITALASKYILLDTTSKKLIATRDILNNKNKQGLLIQQLLSALTTKDIETQEKKIKNDLIKQLIKDKDIDQDKAELIAEQLLGVVKTNNITVTNEETAATVVDTAATQADTVATQLLAKAKMAATSHMLLLVGAIAAVTTVLVILGSKTESASKKLKKSQEVAKGLSDSYNEVKQKVESLKQSFDNYDSVVEKLKSCKRGTDEWKESLNDVNNQVLELMSEFPQLASMQNEAGEKAIIRNKETGALEVADWAKEELLTQADTAAQNAQQALLMGNRDVREKRIEVLKEDAIKYYDDFNTIEGVSWGDAGIAANVYNRFIQEGESFTQEEFIKKLEEQPELESNTEAIERLTEKAMELQKTDADVIKAIEENTLSSEIENDAIMDSVLKDNQEIQESGLANQIADVMGDSFDKYKEDAQKALEEDWGKEDISKMSGANKEARKIFGEYLEAAGLENAGYTLTDTTGTDNNRVFVYTTSEGEEKKISLDQMRVVKATYDAKEAAGEDAKDFLKTVTDLQEGDSVQQAGAEFLLNKNLETLTDSEFQKLGEALKEKSTEELLDDLYGDGSDNKLSSDTLKKLGFDGTYEEMVDAFNNAMESYKNRQNAILESLFNESDYNALNLDSHSLDTKEGVVKVLNTAYAYGGEKGSRAFKSGFQQVIANNELEPFLSTIQGISDWSDISVKDLSKKLKEAGVSTQFTEEQLNAFIISMDKTKDSIVAFDDLASKYKKINDIAKDLKLGDIISKEDFDTLGEGAEDYFTKMLDGTYKLTGDADKFYEFLKQQNIADFNKNIINLNNRKAALENYDLNDISKFPATNGQYEHQIEFLKQWGYEDKEQLLKWEKSSDLDNLEEVTEAITKIKNEVGNFSVTIENLDNEIYKTELAIATSYESFEDLTEAYKRGEFRIQAYNQALMILDKQLDTAGLDAEEWDNYADYIQEIAEDTEYFSDRLAENDEAAKTVSKSILKMNKGIDALSSGYEDWSDVLNNSTKESEEYSKALDGMREALADTLDINKDFISNHFIEKNLKLIGEAASGSEKAIDSLKVKLKDDIISKIKIDNELTPDQIGNMDTAMDKLQEYLNSRNLKVGAELNNAEFQGICQELIDSAGMTVEQVNALFDSMGFETNFAVDQVPTKQVVPQYITETVDYGEEDGTDIDPITGDEVKVKRKKTKTVTYQDGVYEAEGMMEQLAMSTNGKTPIIKGVTRKATSSANNFSSKNSGGGKLGGNSSKGSKKDKKKTSNESERYHVIRKQIEDINDALERTSKAKDKAFGANKLKLLDAENAKRKDLITSQKKYLKEIKDYLAQDTANIMTYGAKFDENDVITNYDAIVKAQVDKYNKAVEKYNNSSQKDADTEALDIAEKEYEQFKQILSKYEETVDLYQQEMDTLSDQELQAFQDKLDGINYTLELNLEINDNSLKLLDEILAQIGEDVDKIGDAIQTLGQKAAINLDNTGKYTTAIIDTLSAYGAEEGLIKNVLAGDLSEEDIRNLASLGMDEDTVKNFESWADSLLECNQNLRDLRDEVHEKLGQAFDEFIGKLEKSSEKIEHLQKVSEIYKDVMDIVGKKVLDANGKLTQSLDRANFDMQRNNTKALKSELDFIDSSINDIENEISKLQALNTNGIYDYDIKKLEEQLEEINDNREATQEEWLESWKAECEAAADIYTDTLNQIVSDFESTVAGSMKNLSHLSDEMARKKDIQDVYVDDYEKIYQLSKLTRDLTKSIDDTSNIRSKRTLRDLQQEIVSLQESGVKLSEYDLQHLRDKYELELARQQLEEAQGAKSQVKMTRDNEGNYGYVYTADQSAVESAEQNYEDKLYQMQKANSEYIDELQERLIKVREDVSARLAELNVADFESTEAYYTAVQEIINDGAALEEELMQQMNNALTNNKELYQTDWAEYSAATGYKISADKDYVDNFNETTFAILTGFNTMEEAHTTFVAGLQMAMTEAGIAYDNWKQDVQIAMEDAGSSIEEFAANTYEWVNGSDGLVEQSEEAASAAEDMADRYSISYETILNDLDSFISVYSDQIENAISSNTDLVYSIDEVISKMAELANVSIPNISLPSPSGGITPNIEKYNSGKTFGSGGDEGFGDDGDNKGTDEGDIPITGTYHVSTGYTQAGVYNTVLYDIKDENGKKIETVGFKYKQGGEYQADDYNDLLYYQKIKWKNEKISSLIEKYRLKGIKLNIDGFDTGGYTGKWNSSEGKIAMLHEKELVLNKDDTEKMLNIVSMVRDISKVIDLNAAAASNTRVGTMGSSIVKSNGEPFQQTVTITAEFKDATTASEITTAFDNLINRASQYANRK